MFPPWVLRDFDNVLEREGSAENTRNRFATPYYIGRVVSRMFVRYGDSFAWPQSDAPPSRCSDRRRKSAALRYRSPFQGRPELNPWNPAFGTQLAADFADFEDEEGWLRAFSPGVVYA